MATAVRGGYERHIDSAIKHGGAGSAHIKSTGESAQQGFATFTQGIRADTYRGKRVRLSGWLKTRNAQSAGLWMRVDGPESSLSFDNMQADRPVTGTQDWKRYEVVLDVPRESLGITFGYLMIGKGEAWADDLKLEAVDTHKVASTNMIRQPLPFDEATKRAIASSKNRSVGNKSPLNLDFER